MKTSVVSVSAFALFVSLTYAASAYETIDVKNGGSIEGVVEFSGAIVPKDPMITPTSETEVCGESMPAKKYLIRNNKIKNVIVYIRDIKAGKKIPREAVSVTDEHCELIPRIAVGFKGNDIVVRNEDPVLHTIDVHMSVNGKELFHVPLHQKGSSVRKTLKTTGIIRLTCYVQPWEVAYVSVFDHPYAEVTDENGKFVINDIPPGTYTVEAWHEALGTNEIANVKVEGGKTSSIRLKFKGN